MPRSKVVLVLPFLAAFAAPSNADAALERCGGVFLSGDAQCEFRREQDCEEHCEVVSVEESCAATLYNSCETECTTVATTECAESCSPVCVENCTVTPAESSAEICRGGCLADCDVKCADARNPECCRRACPHTCNRRCEERCNDTISRLSASRNASPLAMAPVPRPRIRAARSNAKRSSGRAVRRRFTRNVARTARTKVAPSSATGNS